MSEREAEVTAVPLSRSSFVTQAYHAIKQRILGGEFAPGAPLNIDALARQLGVSNSPVREALRRLENERWVETIPFRGAFVRPFDATELRDLYEIRQIVELGALRKVMPHPPAEKVKILGQALERIQSALKSGDPLAYLNADAWFHQVLVDMAGNRRLSEMYATLAEQGRCFVLGRTSEAMASLREGQDQHAELFEAIRGGDTRRAAKILESHLSVTAVIAVKASGK